MSSLAQEESRSISQNVSWGKRKGFAEGKGASLSFATFLGYDKGMNGEWIINEEEAKTVRMIYRMFLSGLSYDGIATRLTEEGVPTASRKGKKWSPSVVYSIIHNEKYYGGYYFQKTYIDDFLTKKQKKNNGELPMYYKEDHHPAIISKEIFDLAQAEAERRKGHIGRYSGMSVLNSRIRCGECGGWYGTKVWHSNDKYRKVVWQCNKKYGRNGTHCKTPTLTEDQIKEAFVRVMNKYVKEKDHIKRVIRRELKKISDTTELEQQLREKESELNATVDMIDREVSDNSRKAQDQEVYQKRYTTLVKRYNSKKNEYDRLSEELEKTKSRYTSLNHMVDEMDSLELIDSFDEGLWGTFVDYVTVNRGGTLVFTMKDGNEIKT